MNKRLISTAIAAHCILLICSGARAFQCNECHSKNPAMVRMHSAVQEKGIGCFDCHKMGEKLMGKGRPKDSGSLLRRRSDEQPCLVCHGPKAR